MVLGLLGLLGPPITVPAVIGTSLGLSQTRQQVDAEEDRRRSQDTNLSIFCGCDSPKQSEVHGQYVVLKDDKVYIECPGISNGYLFSGFYIGYPGQDEPRGLVSMTSDDPPAMGWIYVDKDTLEVKYGNRSASIKHIVGPWDWTEDEEGLILEKQEAFVAVQEQPGVWAIYYDRYLDGEGLPDKPTLAISLERHPKDEIEKKSGP